MSSDQLPLCFSDLDTVFPLSSDGLRQTPDSCMQCRFKTDCLRKAMGQPEALAVREEMIDRAYRGGLIGTFQRWSRKKAIHRLKQSR